VNVNKLRLIDIEWMLNICELALKHMLQMRLENWTTLILNYWKIHGVFRVKDLIKMHHIVLIFLYEFYENFS
jgi:hypothetical protein